MGLALLPQLVAACCPPYPGGPYAQTQTTDTENREQRTENRDNSRCIDVSKISRLTFTFVKVFLAVVPMANHCLRVKVKG